MAPETQMAALVRLFLHLNLDNDIKSVLNVYMKNKTDTNMQVQTWKIKQPGSCGSERVYGEQKRKRRRCPDAGPRLSDFDTNL